MGVKGRCPNTTRESRSSSGSRPRSPCLALRPMTPAGWGRLSVHYEPSVHPSMVVSLRRARGVKVVAPLFARCGVCKDGERSSARSSGHAKDDDAFQDANSWLSMDTSVSSGKRPSSKAKQSRSLCICICFCSLVFLSARGLVSALCSSGRWR